MSQKELVFRIGGAAGDGSASTAESLAKVFTRSGLYVFTYTSYRSVIRGGHSWVRVRASEARVLSQGDRPQALICLTPPTADIHAPQVRENGAIIYDSDTIQLDGLRLAEGVRKIGFPLGRLAREFSNNALMKNTVALGAAVRLFDLDLAVVESAFATVWGDKKREIVDANVRAATAGYKHVEENGGSLNLGLRLTGKARLLITGNQAIALGALAAGCKFLAQYPMTPASSIMHWMADHAPAHGVVVKQVEDELAAMNMAIGAGFAGVRSMTATCGGGFSLMVEGIGQGGMVEAPVVAVLAQRAGPSTGLPTKTEQGDLNLALGAGQGDWPRAILAPRNTDECFRLTAEAFNLAEVYQTPIIVMSDLYLSEGYRTVEGFDFNVPIIRGLLAADGGERRERYLPYKHSDSRRNPPKTPPPVPVPGEETRGVSRKGKEDARGRRDLQGTVLPPAHGGNRNQAESFPREIRRRAVLPERDCRESAGGVGMSDGRTIELQEYKSEIKVTWCPGCGDFAVLNGLQKALQALQLKPWNIVIVSGIGCSSNIPHFLSTYGFHSIHGRAVPVASGIKLANPDLTVIAAGGDGAGDGISVGGLLHAHRGKLDITCIT